jgi:3-hydroxyisobutyrate dehydrogenase
MKETVGFIGIGAMGKPMSLNLLKAGYALTAYDLNPAALAELQAAGASLARSCKDVAAGSRLVITMLPDSAAVEKAILGDDGVMEGVQAGAVVIDMSTIDPSVSRKVSRALDEKGVKMLDAPVSGGTMGAAAGTLAIMVGGDEGAFSRCLPVFQAMGKNITYCGPSGNGEIVKIINNLLFGINLAGVAEALALGVKAGVKFQTLYDVIKSSSGQNWAMQVYCANKGFKGDYEPGFMAELLYKDLGLAMNLAKEERVPLMVGGLAYQIQADINAAGLGKKDCSIRNRLMEDLVGVKLRME